MVAALAAAVSARDESEPNMVCGTLEPSKCSASNIRCRVGSVEMPAKTDAEGVVSCCVPASAEPIVGSNDPEASAVSVEVLGGKEVLLQSQVPLEQVNLLRSRKGRSTQPAENGDSSAAAAPPVAVMSDAAEGGEAKAGGEGGDGKAAGAEGVVPTESRKDAFKRQYSALRPFVIISLSYLLFTTTDGAVRMIVLLHAYKAGFSAWEVAIMFSLYELAGVVTNLAAGMMGARWGIKWTLLSGLTLQLAGVGILYGWQDEWSTGGQKWKAILFVTCAQMLCGVAKDLVKLGGKTVTKLVTRDEQQTRLFKLVSLLTGWKNSLKGVGYFIGAACLSYSYYFALAVLLGLVLAALPWAAVGLTTQLGRARKENLTLARIFKQPYNINVLSVSRYFLFGSRDMWFEVPLPFFLRDVAYGLGWSRPLTGLFLAVWIIVYGQVQSWTPQLVLGWLKQMPSNKYVAVLWNFLLTFVPLFMAIMLQSSDIFKDHDVNAMTGVLVGGLGVFCILFAVNSSVHSYLIVRYAEGDKVAMNVGFYYCANAMGRLTGTLVSGALYSYAGRNVVEGFAACFWASLAFAAMSAAVEVAIKDNSGGLLCGPCFTIVKPPPGATADAGVEVEVE